MIRIAAFILALVVTSPATASDLDSRILFSRGDWVVELTHDTADATLWCTASTINRAAQSLGVSGFDSGALLVHVMDNRWSLRDRSVRFYIDIDRERWTVDGNADGIGVSVFVTQADEAARFLEDLAAGYRVTLRNDAMRGLAEFSLNGSRAALTELMNCWASILQRDPFGTGSDPF